MFVSEDPMDLKKSLTCCNDPGLGVMVEGHRAGELVFQTSILQPSGDVEEEIEFREHGDLMV